MIEAITPSLAPGASAATTGINPARPATGTGAAESPAGDFATMLGEFAAGAAKAVNTAETMSISGIRGQASVHQVVDAVMTAEQTLQGAVAIRDKVVSAYLELSRMSI